MRYELEPNQYAVRIYDQHQDNYIASALVRTYGDRGFMSQITGAGFYKALEENLAELMRRLKVRTLEGYMTFAHARLLRIQLTKANVGAVEIGPYGACAGRFMPWVIVTSFAAWPHQDSAKVGDCNP